MCVRVIARLLQRLKSTFFEIFSHSAGKNSNNVNFSLWGKQRIVPPKSNYTFSRVLGHYAIASLFQPPASRYVEFPIFLINSFDNIGNSTCAFSFQHPYDNHHQHQCLLNHLHLNMCTQIFISKYDSFFLFF